MSGMPSISEHFQENGALYSRSAGFKRVAAYRPVSLLLAAALSINRELLGISQTARAVLQDGFAFCASRKFSNFLWSS